VLVEAEGMHLLVTVSGDGTPSFYPLVPRGEAQSVAKSGAESLLRHSGRGRRSRNFQGVYSPQSGRR
jgi:hypothetical protein